MKYDLRKKILYSKLVRVHQEFMHNHRTISIHCMEREEMENCAQELMDIPSVIAVDEGVITERNRTWVLVLKYNIQTGFQQEDLNAIDKIMVMNRHKFGHHPFHKKQPIVSLNITVLLYLNRLKLDIQ
jgi:hypothetical protein